MAKTPIRGTTDNGAAVQDVRTLSDTVQAQTAWSVTDYTPHASGAVPVTSNAATDLDTVAAALDTLQGEVTALKVILDAAGITS